MLLQARFGLMPLGTNNSFCHQPGFLAQIACEKVLARNDVKNRASRGWGERLETV